MHSPLLPDVYSFSLHVVPSLHQRKGWIDADQQYNHHVLCKQAMGSLVLTTPPKSNPALGLLYQQLYTSESSPPPGSPNMLADPLSRFFIHHHKCSFCPDVARSIFQLYGASQVDLFATKDNTKCHQFCSRAGDSPSSLTSSFLLP